ncbi:hypothetical protein F4778DRAFT_746426 [Xylariomycetidae sp. FL2044]|nr:hypothetical protein F4778DRAFT_746426 [Xylariomycetidae sp. FL2044]
MFPSTEPQGMYTKPGKSLILSIPNTAFSKLQEATLPNTEPQGMYTIYLDPAAFITGPVKEHLSFYSDVREKDGSECNICPRTILRRTLQQATAQNVKFVIMFDIEFTLFLRFIGTTGNEIYCPFHVHQTAWSELSAVKKFLNAMARLFPSPRDRIQTVQVGNAPGRVRIRIPPNIPNLACDLLIHAKFCIKWTARQFGLHASFHPKPFADEPGSGTRVHIKVFELDGKSNADICKYFLQGVLSHMRSLAAFTYPSPVSYERVINSSQTGGCYVAWGNRNQEVPLDSDTTDRVSLQAMDGLANPLIAMAAILTAGIHGIKTKAHLSSKDCKGDPARMTWKQRFSLGIEAMLPARLEEALDELQEDVTPFGIFDFDFVRRYVDIKEAEIKYWEAKSDKECREWILQRY